MSLMPTGSLSLLSSQEERFERISSKDPIAEVIKSAFDMDLGVYGGWGYDADDALVLVDVIASTPSLPQLQHTLASMRSHLEMSLTQPEGERYGGINLTEHTRERRENLEIVRYRIEAMLETDYADFIAAYKQGYGAEDFDMETHFAARKEATLRREIEMWFQV